jgi:hypothetical protein
MTPDDLDRIANWDLDTPKAYAQFMTYIRGLWTGTWFQQNPGLGETQGTYQLLATEEDEELIEAMKDNAVFWSTCWESSDRHGKHVFKTP